MYILIFYGSQLAILWGLKMGEFDLRRNRQGCASGADHPILGCPMFTGGVQWWTWSPWIDLKLDRLGLSENGYQSTDQLYGNLSENEVPMDFGEPFFSDPELSGRTRNDKCNKKTANLGTYPLVHWYPMNVHWILRYFALLRLKNLEGCPGPMVEHRH